jgi:hypothetical protein
VALPPLSVSRSGGEKKIGLWGYSDLSVLKSKRGLSKLEFYHNARKLRRDITSLLLRDFGVRNKVRKIKTDEGEQVSVIEGYP